MRRRRTIMLPLRAIALTAIALAIAVGIRCQASAAQEPSTLTIYPRAGSPEASGVTPHGPGLVLMGGGGDVDSAFVWMHDTIAGSHRGNGGDIIVLGASGANDYDQYLLKLAHFNSVQTVTITRGATPKELQTAAGYVDRSQGVFIRGGDQANYVWWKGSSLAAAIERLYKRGGVVAGNSAGLAIQGEWAYDSVAADATGADVEVTTKNAVPDPSESIISFTHNLFEWPSLRGVITDSHFVQRDRFGRLAVFLARLQQQDGPRNIMGLGIDAESAICVDKRGIGILKLQSPSGSALFLQGGTARPIAVGRPIVYTGIKVTLLDRENETFDFNTRCAKATSYELSVDGTKRRIYDPANPYKPPSTAIVRSCPR